MRNQFLILSNKLLTMKVDIDVILLILTHSFFPTWTNLCNCISFFDWCSVSPTIL